jgi:long-chain acyl-CoA synthetase
MAVLPLFHSFGQTCMLNATIALRRHDSRCCRASSRRPALRDRSSARVTVFAGVPTMYFALLHHPRRSGLRPLEPRGCMAGGAPMPVEVMRAFEEKFGVPILEGYGLSETSPVASFNTPDAAQGGLDRLPGVGRRDGIDDDDKDRRPPDGERGEIVIRGHNIMKGYWKRPEATAETLRTAGSTPATSATATRTATTGSSTARRT